MKRNYDFSNSKTLVLLSLLVLALMGCGDVLGENQESHSEDSGSLLNVEFIDGFYNEENGNQVDIQQDVGGCDDGSTEFYSDHFAQVTISNRSLSNSLLQTASNVYIREYDIEYIPANAGVPAVAPINNIPLTQSVGIPPCTAGTTDCDGVTFTVDMVNMGQKAAILAGFTGTSAILYNVHYTFRGENDFGVVLSAEGYTTFWAWNYDNCE